MLLCVIAGVKHTSVVLTYQHSCLSFIPFLQKIIIE